MSRRVNISTARKELPALFDRVTTRDGERVIILRRDGGEEAVLVGRSYLERLELAEHRRAVEPLKLIGSATLLVSADEMLEELRATAQHEAEKRQRELAPLCPVRNHTGSG